MILISCMGAKVSAHVVFPETSLFVKASGETFVKHWPLLMLM